MSRIAGERSRWRLLAAASLADEPGESRWHAHEGSSAAVAYVAAHRLRGRGPDPIAEPDQLFVVTAGPWVFVRRVEEGIDPASWKLPKQVVEWRAARAPRTRGGRWAALADDARRAPGKWKSATAPSKSAAASAATRLRGGGTSPVAERGELDVRLSEDGLTVFVQIPTQEAEAE